MVRGEDPWSYLGGLVDLQAEGDLRVRKPGTFNLEADNWHVWNIDEEMVEAATLYQDTLRYYMDEGDDVQYEARLDMRHIHPDLFGTGDALIYKPTTRHLIVGDFKYGRGVAVDVLDNEQLLTYAVGALAQHGVENVDKITLLIIQPRAFHIHGHVRAQDICAVDLLLFEDRLREYAAATDDHTQSAHAGHHCRFCPVAWGCDEFRQHVFSIIGINPRRAVMNDLTDQDMPTTPALTPKQLGDVVREVQIIEAWLKRTMEYAHEQALLGNMPENCKLVNKRAYRKFTDVGAVECILDIEGLDESDWMTDPEPEFKSVAVLEKVLGKKRFKELIGNPEFGLVKAESSGYVLAPIDDHRPAAKIDKSDGFGSVSDD